ncbi:MAG: DUF4167 domain-containing protein [Stellaceae bacterium]
MPGKPRPPKPRCCARFGSRRKLPIGMPQGWRLPRPRRRGGVIQRRPRCALRPRRRAILLTDTNRPTRPPVESVGPLLHEATGTMTPGRDPRPRGRYNGNKPSQQRHAPQRDYAIDGNSPAKQIRGNPLQLFERYVALAREAAIGGDRVAVENFYQHAEHYWRINNSNRAGDLRGGPSPTMADSTL